MKSKPVFQNSEIGFSAAAISVRDGVDDRLLALGGVLDAERLLGDDVRRNSDEDAIELVIDIEAVPSRRDGLAVVGDLRGLGHEGEPLAGGVEAEPRRLLVGVPLEQLLRFRIRARAKNGTACRSGRG